jgi:type IV pilus assembly protein PilA
MKNFFTKIAKSFRAGEKGFTLIELLIVIVILGVLAAAIIPNLSKFVGSGNVGAANAELASVRTAVGAYEADHAGLFPCATQPTGAGAANDQLVDHTLIEGATGYVQGTLKGLYKIDNTGVVCQATIGTWPTTIVFANTAGIGLQWVKGTGVNGTYTP